MRHLLSPTVLQCYLYDGSWWNMHGQASEYDAEGYSRLGYNINGIDRAGYCAENYQEKFGYDEEDNAYDVGGSLYLDVFLRYGALVQDTLVVPMAEYPGRNLWQRRDVSWITPDGILFVDHSDTTLHGIPVIDIQHWLVDTQDPSYGP